MHLDALLRILARDPTAPVDLAELALLIAADEYPDLHVRGCLDRVAGLADAVRPRIEAAGDLEGQVAELTAFLFDEERFRGNDGAYYDPRNSYLSDVLDRRLGIPISLSVLAAAVGRRCGLEVVGVGLPGHFVAKAVAGPRELIFDPYHGGRFLDRGGCEALVRAVTGRPFEATDAALAGVPSGVIAQRMLTNLKAAYLKLGDFQRAARVTARLTRLVPGDVTQRRDLGVSLAHAGDPGAAIRHLEAYLTAAPAAADADDVRSLLTTAWGEVAKWN